jgi:hypothetical protein
MLTATVVGLATLYAAWRFVDVRKFLRTLRSRVLCRRVSIISNGSMTPCHPWLASASPHFQEFSVYACFSHFLTSEST